ncbi:MAG: adenylate/guanylate cyclase domain-containing protein, partial [Bacteroidota bacterium]
MNSQNASDNRILAAVMFTDMVGYTALMQENEALARQKRARHREVMEALHKEFSGQIIQYFGDGTLSIFTSSVHALECAIHIQRELQAPIHVPLRIGIHAGEIVVEEDNIIGDAVNLAARIE